MPTPKNAMTRQNNGSVEKKKRAYKGYTFEERLLPSILLSLLAPLTIAFIAPFEIFGNNLEEFKFALGDFWGLCILIALGSAAVLATILLSCRGRVFDVVFGLIFGLSIMFFVQSTFLSLSQTSLGNDGTGAPNPIWQIALNTAIWVIVTVACILVMLLLNHHKDTVRMIATLSLVIALFMTFVSFITVSLTTDVYEKGHETVESVESDLDKDTVEESSTDSKPSGEQGTGEQDTSQKESTITSESESESESDSKAETESESASKPQPVPSGPRKLTVKNLTTLATQNNVIVFVVDRFANEYYHDALAECPEIFSELEGFTFFDDYISLYPRTYPAIPHLVTGVTNDFSLSRKEYFTKSYTESPLMHALADKGFGINIYTDSYYGYEDADDLAGYASNVSGDTSYTIVKKARLSLDMIRLGLYRSLPLVAQPLIGDISTPTFNQYVEYETEHDVFSTDMKEIYSYVTENDFSLGSYKKGYSLIHLAGCHLPNIYDENFGEIEDADKWDSNVSMKQSFKIISRYIQEMKRLGVYENSTIIILGDHTSIGSDKKAPYFAHVTSLLVKPAGSSSGAINVSTAPITTEDIFATILSAAGAPMLEDDWRTVFEIGEGTARVRNYYFQRSLGNSKYEEVVYEIVGSGKNFSNWNIIEVRPLGKSIYS